MEETAAPRPRRLGSPLELDVWIVVFVLWIAALIFFAVIHSTPIDDAYISFRYLQQWLLGHGLVFNPGERVEGYSNLLWILVLSPFGLLRLDIPGVAVVLEIGLAAGCLVLLAIGSRIVLRRPTWWVLAAPVLLALNSTFLFWIGKGMETIFYTTLQLGFAVVVLHFRERPEPRLQHGLWLGLLAAACALTRPEGLMAPGAVLAALLVFDRRRWREYALGLAILVVAVGGQFAFRKIYYGPWFPNTYYAKKIPTLSLALKAGWDYVVRFAGADRSMWFYPRDGLSRVPYWLLWLPALGFAAMRWRKLWPVALQLVAIVAVVIYVGGDWMPQFRFLVPAIALGCLLVGCGLHELAGAAAAAAERWRSLLAIGLFAILLTVEVLGFVRLSTVHEWGRWKDQIENYGVMAQWVHDNVPPDSLVALSDIGIVSYHSPHAQFLDVLGLTDPVVAAVKGLHYEKTDVGYVLEREPDYVLVMQFVYPELGRTMNKTHFDAQFRKHVAENGGYEMLRRVPGWREGMRGERLVIFLVYRRQVSPE